MDEKITGADETSNKKACLGIPYSYRVTLTYLSERTSYAWLIGLLYGIGQAVVPRSTAETEQPLIFPACLKRGVWRKRYGLRIHYESQEGVPTYGLIEHSILHSQKAPIFRNSDGIVF